MTTTPRYSLLSSLGRGGMGEVWLADDAQLGRKVAIKFLAEALEHDPAARERLHREARSAAALDHPFICKIHKIAEIDGRTGIVMEHVPGETLQALLRRETPATRRPDPARSTRRRGCSTTPCRHWTRGTPACWPRRSSPEPRCGALIAGWPGSLARLASRHDKRVRGRWHRVRPPTLRPAVAAAGGRALSC